MVDVLIPKGSIERAAEQASMTTPTLSCIESSTFSQAISAKRTADALTRIADLLETCTGEHGTTVLQEIIARGVCDGNARP